MCTCVWKGGVGRKVESERPNETTRSSLSFIVLIPPSSALRGDVCQTSLAENGLLGVSHLRTALLMCGSLCGLFFFSSLFLLLLALF